MLDFTADWCVSCKEMEQHTFPDQGVIDALKPFMLLRADVTANDANDQGIAPIFSKLRAADHRVFRRRRSSARKLQAGRVHAPAGHFAPTSRGSPHSEGSDGG